MDRREPTTILESHERWVTQQPGGLKANLSGADLSGTDLHDSCLTGADLSRANLSSANLEAVSYGADLSEANLGCANVSGAALGGANLGCASLATTQRYLDMSLDLETTISDFVPVSQCRRREVRASRRAPRP